MKSLSAAQELSSIRTKRENKRSLYAQKEKVNVSQIEVIGDDIRELETTISLPAGPSWPVDLDQTLLDADDDTLELKTALEDYHELALFIERCCWNLTTVTIHFQFISRFGSTALIQSIRMCLRMLASLDRDISFIFTVKLAPSEATKFQGDSAGVLEDGLAEWIDEIYNEIKQTRQANEVEHMFSSRGRGRNAEQREPRVPVPVFSFGP